MARKTLCFTKKPKDLTNDNLVLMVNRITVGGCGGREFTLKDFMPVCGHDDSLPYQAKLCCNGVPFAICFNDGWGGETDITPLQDTKDEFNNIKLYVNDFKYFYQFGTNKMEFKVTLATIADILAETASIEHYRKSR